MHKIAKPLNKLTLKEVRLRLDLTVEKAALQCGLNKATYHNIERGKSFPRPGTIRKIAKAFHVREETMMRIMFNTHPKQEVVVETKIE